MIQVLCGCLCPGWFCYILYGFPSTGGSYVSHYWLSGVVDVGCPSCSQLPQKGGIRKEKEIRNHLLGIVEKAYDSEQDLTSQDKEKAKQLREASIIDNDILHEDTHAHVRQEMGLGKKGQNFILQVSLFLL